MRCNRQARLRFALLGLLAFLSVTFAGEAGSLQPADDAAVLTNKPSADISIQTSAGATVPFTPAALPHLEIVNDQLHLALRSRQGMIFELTGIPAKPVVAARRYRGAEYRALLLHSGFQEEAATDDPFEATSGLEIQHPSASTNGARVTIQYRGQLRAGAETLTVHFQYLGPLPSDRKFLNPTPATPSHKSK
ncbi:MAG: hypothetical protein H7Y43_16855 [Akkermansiaceae bacterium]|nr:hypothetical protein [Verrucomicrobiales bacterium]